MWLFVSPMHILQSCVEIGSLRIGFVVPPRERTDVFFFWALQDGITHHTHAFCMRGNDARLGEMK